MAALGKIRKRGVALVCIMLKKLSVLAKQPRTSSVSRLAKC